MGTTAETRARPVALGDRAPDFTLPTQAGDLVALGDLVGEKAIVLYFYPKDNTPGCTAEACAFRDSYAVFVEAGAEVVGVSSDSVASHAGFAAKNHLPFTLLSDRDGRVRQLYGVEKTMSLLPGRVTYVIDHAGIVRHVFSSQFGATTHVREALDTIQGLHTRV
jgi:peroxiredoxin Q/BCP